MYKPILKWVGGKTQIMEHVLNKFPQEINNYHEPFLGGGSVLFNVLQNVREGIVNINNVYACDINEALVYVYKNIQCFHAELYNEIIKMITLFNNIIGRTVNRTPENLIEAQSSRESYYYYIRRLYNQLTDKQTINASAMFIFLNKTCFRGLYRVGPNGFNVPYGNNKNPEIINKQHLEEIHELVQGVVFTCCDFTESLKFVKNDDFVYLDPPYVPINNTSFVAYNKGGFDKHVVLFDTLKTANYKYLMSNSDTDFVKQHFDNYEIIKAKRNINSRNPDSIINELLIFN